ncbi:MAG: RidA family protein [Rhizobacter sp.]|nr:RidA family protein [Rhizobacter sp.]
MTTSTLRLFQAPPGRKKLPPLSVAARVGDLIFISGTPGYDANEELADDFKAQFLQSVETLKRTLESAGSDLRHIAKNNVLLTRASDVAEMNRLYAEAFGPAPYPARTTCVVAALPDPRMLMEIECVAVPSTFEVRA